MHGNRTLPALLLAFALGLPASAQEAQPTVQPPAQPPTPQPNPPAATPPAASAAPTSASTPAQAPTPGSDTNQATPPELTPQGPIEPVAPTPGATPSAGVPGTTAAPAPTPPAGPPGAGPDRLDFELKFTPEHGGGSAAGSAGNLEYKREDYAVLTGGVQIRYQDIDLKSDQAEIDLETKIVTAKGNVVIDQGPRRLTGETAVFNLDTKTGKLENSSGQVAPDYYFKGKEVEKTGADTYVVRQGVFTSCSQPVPDWSFRVREATIEVDGYAHVHSASMFAKKLPVLYTPYLIWPVKKERASGFLIPNLGFSDRRGAQLGLAYFQTLGRSYDTTFHVDLFSKNYLGIGDEFRYQPTAGTRGGLITYFVRDSQTQDWRWKVELNQTSNDLPYGMRGVVQYQDFSDFNFFRDFERDFDRSTQRFIDSRAFVAGNWGPHLVNLLFNSRETFTGQGLQTSVTTQRKLPELEYRLRSTRILRTPFYLDVDTTLDYLQQDRPGSYSGSYGRFDLAPQITLPVRTFPWLDLSVSGGGRVTWYSDTVDPAQTAFRGESLSRAFPTASARIVGPSVSKIFAGTLGGFKIKHIIEPRFTYTYLGDIDPNQGIPQFDEVDNPRSTNRGRIALDNRILAKPDTPEGSSREVFLFEIARNYSFDPTQTLQGNQQVQTTQGPLEGLLRFNPAEKISLNITADYNTLFHGISNTSLTGNYGFGQGNYVGATWFTASNPATGKSLSNQARLSGGFTITPWRLRLEGSSAYDFEQQLLQDQTVVANYTGQCYGLRLQLRRFHSGNGPANVQDKEIRFSLSLKNVGTFLDLNSRTSTNQP